MDRNLQKITETFSFDPGPHIYRLGRKVIPGITDIIRLAGAMRISPGSDLETPIYMQRGTAVHRATELYDKDILDWSTVSDEIYGYVLAWTKFREETNFRPVQIETPLFHPGYFFAGTPDRGGFFGKKGAVVEIKTGTHEDWHALQTAAQDLLLPKLQKPRIRMCVCLGESGGYSVKSYEDPLDHKVFLSFLTAYNWRCLHGYIESKHRAS